MPQVHVDPVDELGNVKSADDCFIEAFKKQAVAEPTSSPTEEVYDLAVSSVGGSTSHRSPVHFHKESQMRIFETDHASPNLYAKFMSSKYEDWIEWEPETIIQTLFLEHAEVISEVAKNKLFAVQSLLASDAFFNEWHVFEKTILALNGVIPNFSVLEFPSPGQIVYGILEAKRIRPLGFSDEIREYIKAVLDEAGFIVYPKELAFVRDDSDIADKMKVEWRKIAKENEIPETKEGIQLGRLAAIAKYVEDMSRMGLGIEEA